MYLAQSKKLWLAGSALALLLGGCSKPADDGTEPDGESGKGVLSKVFETTKHVTVPEGTVLHVTVDETLTSNKNHACDSFAACVSEPVVVGGTTVIPKGARATGAGHSGEGVGPVERCGSARSDSGID